MHLSITLTLNVLGVRESTACRVVLMLNLSFDLVCFYNLCKDIWKCLGLTKWNITNVLLYIQSRQPRLESVESLRYHWGSCVGDGIQLSHEEGRSLDLSLPLSLGGESKDPSPEKVIWKYLNETDRNTEDLSLFLPQIYTNPHFNCLYVLFKSPVYEI